MALINCFFSYSHEDNKANNNRIRYLYEDIKNEYKALTGEQPESGFIDINDIRLGDKWKEVITDNLNNLPIFLPVISPWYFNSENCRDEFKIFYEKTLIDEFCLIIPIFYIHVESFIDADPRAELLRIVNETQYLDFTATRFKPRDSEEYKMKVNEIVKRIIEGNKELERRSVVQEHVEEERDNSDYFENDDAPGYLDELADFDAVFDLIIAIQYKIGDQIKKVAEVMDEGTSELNTYNLQKKPMSAKLLLIKKNARSLAEPVDGLYNFCNEYSEKMVVLDRKVIAFLSVFSATQDTQSTESIQGLENSLEKLVSNAKIMSDGLPELLRTFEWISKMSKDFRPILRKMNVAFTTLKEANLAFTRWLNLFKGFRAE